MQGDDEEECEKVQAQSLNNIVTSYYPSLGSFHIRKFHIFYFVLIFSIQLDKMYETFQHKLIVVQNVSCVYFMCITRCPKYFNTKKTSQFMVATI